jgi:hypothetical protein
MKIIDGGDNMDGSADYNDGDDGNADGSNFIGSAPSNYEIGVSSLEEGKHGGGSL